MTKRWLAVVMVCIGMIYATLLHFLEKPLFNNVLIHCIILGALFGLTNFVVVNFFTAKVMNLKEDNQRLRVKLVTDTLTGLLNRRAFEYDINNIEFSDEFSLLFIDIDNFRNFNNKFGHDVGDKVLRKVSQTIKSCVRGNDRVYRYGGEEIVLLLIDCDKRNGWKIAEKIRNAVKELNNQPYPRITVSLGVSTYPEDGNYIRDVLATSDKALLRAKRSGKNCTIASKNDKSSLLCQ